MIRDVIVNMFVGREGDLLRKVKKVFIVRLRVNRPVNDLIDRCNFFLIGRGESLFFGECVSDFSGRGIQNMVDVVGIAMGVFRGH